MRTTRKTAQGRSLRALTMTLVLALLAALLLAGTALAATPGKPTAKAPKGTITQVKPTFKWSKAPRAAKYEVRVYKGSTLKVKKTGITTLSWKCGTALSTNVNLTWKVRGRNASGNGAWSNRLTFKVVPLSSTKAITAFGFASPAATGVITELTHTIALTVPFGTNVSALVATFATTGASVAIAGTPQVSGTTADNFSNPVTYRVTAANASTQDYLVTVTVAANPAKAITAFSFQGWLSPPVTGIVTEAAHTIALTVPFGTNVTNLVAAFSTTGASVRVGATLQVSGATANNFTSPVTYRVTAADASTQDYAVTVTVAAPVIGQDYGGGKIAYVLQFGDTGYLAGQTHGLIAAATDQSAGTMWAIAAYQSTLVPGGTLTAIGTGSANTDKIIAQNGAGSTYAAGLARAYTDGVYTDWYLPSKDELNELYLNQVAIGGFTASAAYWSSSEVEGYVYTAWSQGFVWGNQNNGSKTTTVRVRAVRAF